MDVNGSTALLPLPIGIQPVASFRHKDLDDYGYHDQPQSRIKFLGYKQKESDDRQYNALGQKLNNIDDRGGLVDIYV